MKTIFLSMVCMLSCGLTLSQSRYITRTGHISFFSKAPLENIEAHNYQVNSIFDKDKGELAFSVLIKGFEFEKALMQEHFNENFLESHLYPKATFTGKIIEYEQVKWEEGIENMAQVTGEMTIHGVTKKVAAEGTVKMEGGKIMAKSTFPLRPEDYKIKIPGVVRSNIAEIVDVHVDLILEPYLN